MNSYYRIADHIININNNGNELSILSLLPSFVPFKCDRSLNENVLFTLTIDEAVSLIDSDRVHRIRTFDTGNGDTVVDRLDDGGYQFVIKNIKGEDCVLLITNKNFSDCKCSLYGTSNMRRLGLNNA